MDLASLEISEEGKNEVEVYAAGQLKNLRSAEGQVSGIEVMDDHTLVNITVRVRLLRTSYLWTSSFFTEGILSMYYTCGQKLPLAIFKVSHSFDQNQVLLYLVDGEKWFRTRRLMSDDLSDGH